MNSKKILITGASRGIGKKIFQQLNKNNNKLFLISNNKNRIKALRKIYKNPNIKIFECDLKTIKNYLK